MKSLNFTYMNLLITCVAVFFLSVSGINSALAEEKGEEDIKYYSAASVCYSPVQNSFGNLRRMEFGADGSIENPSATKELEVICPLLRDNTGGKGIEVMVNVEHADRHSIQCRLEARELDGKKADAPKKYQSATASTGRKYFWLELSNNELSGGIAIVQCRIPKLESNDNFYKDGSRIISMRVRENP